MVVARPRMGLRVGAGLLHRWLRHRWGCDRRGQDRRRAEKS
jgi:hypothetical protein